MRTQDLEVCGDSFVLENTRNAPRNPKKPVGRYCGTYTGKVTEMPIFTLPLHHSETSGVAPGGPNVGSGCRKFTNCWDIWRRFSSTPSQPVPEQFVFFPF